MLSSTYKYKNIVAHYTARSKHTKAWNTCCHNTANLITMYFLLINSTLL